MQGIRLDLGLERPYKWGMTSRIADGFQPSPPRGSDGRLEARRTRGGPTGRSVVGLAALLTLAALCGCDFFEKHTLIGQLLADPGDETVERPEVDRYDAGPDTYTGLAREPVFLFPETAAASGDRLLWTASGQARAFSYDAASGGWTEEASLGYARSGAVALAYGDQVVVCTGRDQTGKPAQTIEIFDLSAPTSGWRSVALPVNGAGLPTGRAEQAVAIQGDLLVLAGGVDTLGAPSTAVTVLDLGTVSTSPAFAEHLGVLPTARVRGAAFVSDVPSGQPGAGTPRIHIVGGEVGDGVSLATDLVLSVSLAAASLEATLVVPTARRSPQLVVGPGEVLSLPSRLLDQGLETAVDLYDCQAGAWTAGPALPRALRLSSAVYAEGAFRVFGGLTGTYSVGDAFALDPADLLTGWTGRRAGRKRHQALALVVGGRATLLGGYQSRKKDRDFSPF